MFQNLRTGNRTVFGNVANDKYRRAVALGIFEKRRCALANLRYTTCRRVDKVGIDCLNRVDNHEVGLQLIDLGDDIFEQGLGVDDTLLVADADARSSELDLLGRFLARNV